MYQAYVRKEMLYFVVGFVIVSFISNEVETTQVPPTVFERTNMCPYQAFDGFVVTSLYLLWTKPDRNLTSHCAVDCYRDQKCRAFFYNRLTLSCQGHFNSSLSVADAVPEAGWVHYRYCLQTDCIDAYAYGRDGGIYTVAPSDGIGDIRVICDMRTDGGGWLVFQRRRDGSETFSRGWIDYKSGFGNLENEFWLGNDFIHRLTAQRTNRLRIEMEDFEDDTCVSTYSTFYLASEADLYMLTSGVFSGQCGNSFSYGSGLNFSTIDRDNDSSDSWHCANIFQSGWWFGACHSSNLNGQYNNTDYAAGVCWALWKGYYYSLKFSEMKFRP